MAEDAKLSLSAIANSYVSKLVEQRRRGTHAGSGGEADAKEEQTRRRHRVRGLPQPAEPFQQNNPSLAVESLFWSQTLDAALTAQIFKGMSDFELFR